KKIRPALTASATKNRPLIRRLLVAIKVCPGEGRKIGKTRCNAVTIYQTSTSRIIVTRLNPPSRRRLGRANESILGSCSDFLYEGVILSTCRIQGLIDCT